jgi:hypothetical protein
MPPFEYTDSPFGSDAPARASVEPPLSFVDPPCRCFPPWVRQDHTTDATSGRGLLIGRRRESAIRGGHIRCSSKHSDVMIDRRGPQRLIGRSLGVHVVRHNDLMLGLLDRDQLAEFSRLHVLPFSDRFGMRFKHAEHLVGDVGVTAEDARARLLQHAFGNRPPRIRWPMRRTIVAVSRTTP